MSTGACEMSVFQALSGGKIGQAPIAGPLLGAGGAGPGAAPGVVSRMARAFAQRWRRQGRTL